MFAIFAIQVYGLLGSMCEYIHKQIHHGAIAQSPDFLYGFFLMFSNCICQDKEDKLLIFIVRVAESETRLYPILMIRRIVHLDFKPRMSDFGQM